MKLLLKLGLLALLAWCVPSAQAQITFVGAGAIDGDLTTTDSIAPLPTGTATNDILLVYCWVRNTGDTMAVTGYTQVAQVDTGTGSHSVWWKRHDGSEGSATCNKSASADSYARQYAFRGVRTTGDPWDVLSTFTADNGTTDPTSFTGITTLTASSMVVSLDAYEDNDASVAVVTGTDPAAYTENYAESSVGADGSIEIAYAIRSAAGATGSISIAYGTISTRTDDMANLIMALVPAPAPCANTDYGNGFTCIQDDMWGSTTSGTGGSITFASATTAGNNVIAVTQFCDDSACSTTATETVDWTNGAGNTETLPTTSCRGTSSSASFVYRICAGIFANVSATSSFTCTVSGTVWYVRCHFVEFSGGSTSSPWDGDTVIGATSGAATSLTVNYTSSGTVLNYGSISTLGATTITEGTGFTEMRDGCSEGTCGVGNQREGRGVTSGTNNCSWTFGSDQAIGMCFGMAKAGGGGPTPQRLTLIGVGD